MKLNPDTNTLTLFGDMDIDHAPQLKENLINLLQSPSPVVEVRLEGLTGVDLSILQLLAAAAISAQRLGKQWCFRNPPEMVRSKLILTGLDVGALHFS